MRALRPLLFLSAVLLTQPLSAALPVGVQAPDFTTTGAVGGRRDITMIRLRYERITRSMQRPLVRLQAH